MWWWLEKIEDTTDAAIYGYGVETQNASGKIVISKTSNEIMRIRLADNDNDTLFKDVFVGLVRSIIPKESYPMVRSIATG